jgi:DNA-binding transcriptional MerR regulator
MEVFELAEVAEVLGMPKSKVKNWTIGRPLRITPSVRVASGKGTRNLYSVEDVYVLTLANQLNEDGFSPKAIQAVIKKVRRKAKLIGKYYSQLVVSSPGRVLKIEFLSGDLTVALSETLAGQAGVVSRYILDLKAVREWIDSRIAKIRKRQQG